MSREYYVGATITDGKTGEKIEAYQKSPCCNAPIINHISVAFGPPISYGHPVCRCCKKPVKSSDDINDYDLFDKLNKKIVCWDGTNCINIGENNGIQRYTMGQRLIGFFARFNIFGS